MRSTTNSGARRRRRRRLRSRPRERPHERVHARASWRVEQELRGSAQRGPSRAAAARRPPTDAVRSQLVGLTGVPYLPAIPARPFNQPRGALCVSAQRCSMPGAAGGSGVKQACASRRMGTRGGAADARDASVMQICAVAASCASAAAWVGCLRGRSRRALLHSLSLLSVHVPDSHSLFIHSPVQRTCN
jgi:hypothetical protein